MNGSTQLIFFSSLWKLIFFCLLQQEKISTFFFVYTIFSLLSSFVVFSNFIYTICIGRILPLWWENFVVAKGNNSGTVGNEFFTLLMSSREERLHVLKNLKISSCSALECLWFILFLGTKHLFSLTIDNKKIVWRISR